MQYLCNSNRDFQKTQQLSWKNFPVKIEKSLCKLFDPKCAPNPVHNSVTIYSAKALSVFLCVKGASPPRWRGGGSAAGESFYPWSFVVIFGKMFGNRWKTIPAPEKLFKKSRISSWKNERVVLFLFVVKPFTEGDAKRGVRFARQGGLPRGGYLRVPGAFSLYS